jgi:hypothetical protein
VRCSRGLLIMILNCSVNRHAPLFLCPPLERYLACEADLNRVLRFLDAFRRFGCIAWTRSGFPTESPRKRGSAPGVP